MEALNGDLGRTIVLRTDTMQWERSPSATVWRRRLHRVGPAESGQVTSVVRYEPGARFPAHEHPEGEEILVLDGVFSDEHGDWPAGTYLLNPEGFRHAPFSREGCVLFVKLRQAPGPDRRHVVVDTRSAAWSATGCEGVESAPLWQQAGYSDRMTLERWAPGAGWEAPVAEGTELFVIEGLLLCEGEPCGPRSWLRFPEGATPELRSTAGCVVYVKRGGFPYLHSENGPAA